MDRNFNYLLYQTKKELIGIVGAVTVILLLVLLFIVCQRMRVKRRRNGHRPHSLNIDSNGKELVPLNSTRPHGDLPDFKRSSKMSNLEVSQVKAAPAAAAPPLMALESLFLVCALQSPPMLPPRPASYTPSANEPTYIPLNNLDTIRSYGSAADELETYPMLAMPTFGTIGHNNPDFHPNLNRNGMVLGSSSTNNGGLGMSRTAGSPLLMADHDALSDSDSLHKPCWSDVESNLKGSYYEAAKIHNGTWLLSLFNNWRVLPLSFPPRSCTPIMRPSSPPRFPLYFSPLFSLSLSFVVVVCVRVMCREAEDNTPRALVDQ